MKSIHPTMHETEIVCASCGNKFTVRSTAEKIEVDVCSNCHPFYTGKQGKVSKAGKIEKFNKKYNLNQEGK